MQRNTFFI